MKLIRTYILPFCLALAFLFISPGADAQTTRDANMLRWGIKAGLNAPTAIDFDAFYNGELLEGESVTNRVGYTLSAFTRITLDEFFFQPELSWNMYKQKLSFDLPVEGSETGMASTLNLKYYSANINMLAGYNIIHEGPYIFSAMLGASFRYSYKTDFDFSNQTDFDTNKPDYNYLGVGAVSFVIDKVFFEFRYEFNFPNSNIDFSKISEADDKVKLITLNKKDNILSFSCGLIF